MAMDLFCYSSKSSTEVQKTIDLISKEHQELFASKYLIGQVREVGEVQKEIAFEHGLNASSIFLIRYNDKSAIGLSSVVVDVIETALGNSNAVILFENETLK